MTFTENARPTSLTSMQGGPVPRTWVLACWIVPILFGLYSVAQGADTNWDLRNYHLYSGFAFLHDKQRIDLAAAGMQGYFNPLLDVAYYWMAMHLPAPVLGFIMGTLHGMNFVVLLGTCRCVVGAMQPQRRSAAPLWLALAGCVTANFMSGVGNSMGDDTTSLFALGALWLVSTVWRQRSRRRIVVILLAAGAVSGIGAGLKLTTLVYAMALCVALAFAPLRWPQKLRSMVLFGVGVLLGIALSSGFWFAEMWRLYGNPLYPQFSSVFPSPLTAAVGVVDRSWRPTGPIQAFLFPFIFSFDPLRVGQVRLHQIIWAVLYVVFWAWIGVRGIGKTGGGRWMMSVARLAPGLRLRALGPAPAPAMPAAARYVLAYVALGYIGWLGLFSVQRYLVSIELCVPLVLFILLRQIFVPRTADRWLTGLLLVCSAMVLAGGAHSWGHAAWTRRMFAVDTPLLTAPDKTTVVITSGADPYSWIVPFFPASVAFAQLQSAFPQARPAFDEKLHAMIATRGGPAFAVIPGQGDSDRPDDAANTAQRRAAVAVLASYGLALQEQACKPWPARIGSAVYWYQWCAVRRAH